MIRTDDRTLKNFCGSIFEAAGASAEESAIVADSLVLSNLLGHDSHGIIRVMQYVNSMREGKIVPGAELAIVTETDTTMVLDGCCNFGQVIARRATERAIEKAKKAGIVQMGVRNGNHIGRLGEYTQQAAEAGMLAIMMVNNSGAAHVVAPFGGTQGRLATNPIAFAAPWKDDQCFVLDMTTSITAEGKFRVLRNKGEKVPEGWMLDSEGKPSTDPADLYGPPWGAILPLGGPMAHKGFGLGLMVEILSGLMSGAGVSRPEATRIANGVFAIVMNIEAFMPRETYDEQVRGLMDYIKSCPTQSGFDEVLIHGEPEYRTRRQREEDGIPIDDETWRQLTELAGELGVEAPDADVMG